MLQNEHLFSNISADTAENGPTCSHMFDKRGSNPQFPLSSTTTTIRSSPLEVSLLDCVTPGVLEDLELLGPLDAQARSFFTGYWSISIFARVLLNHCFLAALSGIRRWRSRCAGSGPAMSRPSRARRR